MTFLSSISSIETESNLFQLIEQLRDKILELEGRIADLEA